LISGLASSIVTPSLGDWYAGDWFTVGMAVRIGAVGLSTFAVTRETHEVVCEDSSSLDMRMCTTLNGTAVALIGIAAIAYIGAAAYDVSQAPEAVHRYNRKYGTFVSAAPMAGPTGSAPGVLVSGYF
jgi:hypothetical protein